MSQQLQLNLFDESSMVSQQLSGDLSIDVNDLIDGEFPLPTTVVPEFLVTGEATMLASIAGGAKTYLAQYVAACSATGTNCFGYSATSPLPTLYIDAELSKPQLKGRYCSIFKFLGKRPKRGFFKVIHKRTFKGGMPDLSTPEGYQVLLPYIEKYKVIIIDNISSLYRGADEMIQRDWNFYNECLDDMREKDKAVLVLHHTDKKGENYRGHSEIARAIDHSLISKKDEKFSNNTKTVIHVFKPKNRNDAGSGQFLSFEFGAIGNQGEFEFRKIK